MKQTHIGAKGEKSRPSRSATRHHHETPDGITAPYNFVPVSLWVFEPEWAAQAGHDVPFRDGLSGTLECTITAHSPILVAGPREATYTGKPGQAHFTQLPDGRYAIPGSSLRGMLRNVLEVLSFAKMRHVDDTRHSIRDITGGGKVDDSYKKILTPDKSTYTARTGFMRLEENGTITITPCNSKRISHRVMEELVGWTKNEPIFPHGMSVAEKYAKWRNEFKVSENQDGHVTTVFSAKEKEQQARDLRDGDGEGILVMTTQISAPKIIAEWKKGQKYRDFIFYNPSSTQLNVADRVWRDFLFIHGAQSKEPSGSNAWSGYWRDKFHKRQSVPVFFISEGSEVQSIGLAYLYRLAYKHDVTRLIPQRHFHDDGSPILDLCDLIFGCTGDKPEHCLKGRVHIGTAVQQSKEKPSACDPTILNGPKPTYFPNYIRQHTTPGDPGRLATHTYKTYMHDDAEIRGFKRYPARAKSVLPELTDKQRDSSSILTQMHPLPPGSRFKTSVRFHNLKPEELGAVVWALSWGGDGSLRHTIGMGKPFGFGQISCALAKENITANDPKLPAPTLPECVERYQRMMDTQYRSANATEQAWLDSSQLVQLQAMANPAMAPGNNRELRHMRLEPNEFVNAKKAGWVLPDYTSYVGIPDSDCFPDAEGNAAGEFQTPSERWLADTLESLAEKHNSEVEVQLRGKSLAEAWEELGDEQLKRGVYELIRAKWEERNWWERPPGKSAKKARAVYPDNMP